ncbi:MAG: hypothetical protein V4632_13420 [Pseudomonadota bacterium]
MGLLEREGDLLLDDEAARRILARVANYVFVTGERLEYNNVFELSPLLITER